MVIGHHKGSKIELKLKMIIKMAKLKKSKELLDSGAINEEEFENI